MLNAVDPSARCVATASPVAPRVPDVENRAIALRSVWPGNCPVRTTSWKPSSDAHSSPLSPESPHVDEIHSAIYVGARSPRRSATSPAEGAAAAARLPVPSASTSASVRRNRQPTLGVAADPRAAPTSDILWRLSRGTGDIRRVGASRPLSALVIARSCAAPNCPASRGEDRISSNGRAARFGEARARDPIEPRSARSYTPPGRRLHR